MTYRIEIENEKIGKSYPRHERQNVQRWLKKLIMFGLVLLGRSRMPSSNVQRLRSRIRDGR